MPQQQTGDEPYQITGCTLFKGIMNFLFRHAFLIYYTYGYSTIPKSLAYTDLSICFLVYIILCYISNIPSLVEVIYIYRHMGEMTTKNLWKVIVPNHRRPLVYIRWTSTVCLALGCYFLSKFIPIGGDNCDIYTGESKDACTSIQIICVFTLMALSAIALVIILLLLYGCCFCCVICISGGADDMSFRSYYRQHRQNSLFMSVSDLVSSQLPIVTAPPHDKICSICHEDAQEGEQWMVLTCDHKFHPDCIKPWLTDHNTCPLCRKEQNVASV